MTPKITAITSNMEKKTTYQTQMERFKRAKAGGFKGWVRDIEPRQRSSGS